MKVRRFARNSIIAVSTLTLVLGGGAAANASSTVKEVKCSSANTFRLYPKTGLDRCFTGHGIYNIGGGHFVAFFSGPSGGQIYNIDHWVSDPGPNKAVQGNYLNVWNISID